MLSFLTIARGNGDRQYRTVRCLSGAVVFLVSESEVKKGKNYEE